MADLSITAASLVTGPAPKALRTAAAAFSIGSAVYLNSDKQYDLGDTLDTDTLNIAGVCLTGGSSGDRPIVAVDGSTIDFGSAILTKGETYYLSESGGIAPRADLAASDNLVLIGIAESTQILQLVIRNTGIVL